LTARFPAAPVEIASNIVGLVGLALLSVPVLYANKYANLIYRVHRSAPNYADASIAADRQLAAEQLAALRDQWTPCKSRCLIGGTGLTALSYLLPLLKCLWTLLRR